MAQARIMGEVLHQFCLFSGQKVNLHKSRVWYSKNTSPSMIQQITANFGIPSTSNLGMYLGIPLFHDRLTSRHFQYLEERVRGKLGIWQSHLLSRVAKLLLIQSVCSAIPTYAMNVCKLPGKTVTTLEKLHQNFFWGDSDRKRTTHVLGWDQICHPRNMGGLGLRAVPTSNAVMLVKFAWKFMTHRESLWSSVLHAKYKVSAGWETLVHGGGGSVVWQGLKHRYSHLATSRRNPCTSLCVPLPLPLIILTGLLFGN